MSLSNRLLDYTSTRVRTHTGRCGRAKAWIERNIMSKSTFSRCGIALRFGAFGVLGLWGQAVGAAVPQVAPVVLNTYSHDPQAFTQGLLFAGEELYESTGLNGRSTVRLVELATGAVKRSVNLPSDEFGEGLAWADGRLVQLTWKSGVAHVYAPETFEVLSRFDYTGEGWGLCFDGKRLIMSDGSSSLFFRDVGTFAMTGSVAVTRDGYSVRQLNELECVNGWVYANVWQTKQIVKIDPGTGEVAAVITVDGLLTPDEARRADVLNGIAYQASKDRFFITGKLWPKLFEVEFTGAGAPSPAPDPAKQEVGSAPVAPTVIVRESAASSAGGAKPNPPAPEGQTPPKVNGGCGCAALGANVTGSSSSNWGLAVLLPLLGCGLRARKQKSRRT